MNSKYLENYKSVIRGDSFIPRSLLDFTSECIEKFKPQSIIELGSDRGQLLAQLEIPSKIGLELSELAVNEANALYSNFKSYSHNVLFPWSFKADLIIDSHLFHCLVSREERLLYLKNVKRSLNPEGRFLIECMGKPNNFLPNHILVNEVSQIWAQTNQGHLKGAISINGRSYIPFRYFFNPNTENEILESGFKIHSLIYTSSEFEFTVLDEKIQAPLVRLVLG